jgi:hypothetical protein
MVQFGDFTIDEIKKDGFAASDEVMICSVVKFPEGGGSIAWHSSNGKPNESVGSSNSFKAWLALAAKIAAQSDLNNVQREIVLNALNSAKTRTEKL